MGIQDQGTISSGAAHKVVPGVTDDEAKVVGSGKVDGGFDLGGGGGGDDVGAVETACTGGGGRGGEGQAGVVCPVCPEV
jgi:hypothetical protein